jgi:hypothetical protein
LPEELELGVIAPVVVSIVNPVVELKEPPVYAAVPDKVTACPVFNEVQKGVPVYEIVADGTGVTFIVTEIGVPEHPFTVGVIVYTTEPGFDDVAIKVCAIVSPVPALAPETLF